MKWYAVNKDYVRYLKQYDNVVPDVEYTGRLKCFLGILIKSREGCDYFAPLTSYKPKFITMNNSIDFYKIENENGKIYGAIDLNNMIPVPETEYTEVNFATLPTLRVFESYREMVRYWKLLNTEMSLINEDVLLHNAEKLYRFVVHNPNSALAERCCNFTLLENKCVEYIERRIEPQENIDMTADIDYEY